MPRGEFFYELAHRTPFPAPGLGQSFGQAAEVLQQLTIIQQFLVGLGSLQHGFSLTIDRKERGTADPPQISNPRQRLALKV